VEVNKGFNGKTEVDGHNFVVSSPQVQDALINPTLNQNELIKSKPITAGIVKSHTNSSPKNAVWTKDIYEPGFSYPNPPVCPNDGLDIRLVILITSAPGHFSARDAIRLTWGHYSQRVDVSIGFLIGKEDFKHLHLTFKFLNSQRKILTCGYKYYCNI